MTNHTREQLIDAWEALDRMNHGHYTLEAYNHDLAAIKAVLPERPKQTMQEIGWDQDQHFLLEADHNGIRVAMLGYSYGSFTILTNDGYLSPLQLIPTGRRYKLILDDDHPEYLETEQDYVDAPEGTVVVMRVDGLPAVKHCIIWKSIDWAGSDEKMSGERRRVLRWGWGG